MKIQQKSNIEKAKWKIPPYLIATDKEKSKMLKDDKEVSERNKRLEYLLPGESAL